MYSCIRCAAEFAMWHKLIEFYKYLSVMAGILVMIFELTVQHAYLFVGFFSLWVAPKNVIKLYYIS